MRCVKHIHPQPFNTNKGYVGEMSDLSVCLSHTTGDAVLIQPRGCGDTPNYASAHALVRRTPVNGQWVFLALMTAGGMFYTTSGIAGDVDTVTRAAQYQLGGALDECDAIGVSYHDEGFPDRLKFH